LEEILDENVILGGKEKFWTVCSVHRHTNISVVLLGNVDPLSKFQLII